MFNFFFYKKDILNSFSKLAQFAVEWRDSVTVKIYFIIVSDPILAAALPLSNFDLEPVFPHV